MLYLKRQCVVPMVIPLAIDMTHFLFYRNKSGINRKRMERKNES